ncbi:MAG: flagellar biosynthesis protein FlhF, partial [Bacillota bacterium]
KLAANFSLIEDREVGLVTADTYRIAAVEQLKTYSEIIDVPLEVVYNSNELTTALQRFSDKDLILVDTAGRSQNNKMHMSELNALLAKIDVDETHLVLSANIKYNDLLDIIANFREVKLDKFIFTKLDETNNLGVIYNLLEEFELPLSYIADGQDVPEDIEIFAPQKLIDNFLKE